MEFEFHYRRHKSQPLRSGQEHRRSSTNSQINSVTFVLILPSHLIPGALSILSNSDFYIKGLGILQFTVASIRRRTHSVMHFNMNISSNSTCYPLSIKDITSHSKINKICIGISVTDITFLSLLNFLLGFCLYFL
jgi:hypothetical protein